MRYAVAIYVLPLIGSYAGPRCFNFLMGRGYAFSLYHTAISVFLLGRLFRPEVATRLPPAADPPRFRMGPMSPPHPTYISSGGALFCDTYMKYLGPRAAVRTIRNPYGGFAKNPDSVYPDMRFRNAYAE